MLKDRTKDIFWWTVVASLIDLFDNEVDEAVERTVDLKRRLKDHENPLTYELIYHDEALDVARDLAHESDGDAAEPDAQRYETIIQLVTDALLQDQLPDKPVLMPFDISRPDDLKRAAHTLQKLLEKQLKKEPVQLRGKRVQPAYDLFISYRHKDEALVHRLRQSLADQGLTAFWSDTDRLKTGTQWNREIQRAIDSALYLVLILTPDTIVSDWMQLELEAELQYAAQRQMPVILLSVGVQPSAVPPLLRQYQWIDVRGRPREEALEEGVSKLVHQVEDLKRHSSNHHS